MATARERRQAERQREAEAGGKGQTAREKAAEEREKQKKETARERRQAERQRAVEAAQPKPTEPAAPVTLPRIDLTTEKKESDMLVDLEKGPLGEVFERGRYVKDEPVGISEKSLIAGAIAGTAALGAIGLAGISAKIAASTAIKVGLATSRTAGGMAINSKTIGLSTGVLNKRLSFSVKTMAVAGTWASSVFLGRWGHAEAAEPITIPLRDAIRQAEITGDWSTVEEYSAIADEITNPSIWKEIALWSPLAAIFGIQDKIKGVSAGVQLLKELAKNERIAQETGESADDKWKRIREQEAEEDKIAVDYYNEQRKLMVEWELEAEAAARGEEAAEFEAGRERQRTANAKARAEDAAFWRKERAKQSQMEAEDRKAIADFWIAYRKEALKLANDNRPSNLNFGLL